MDCESRVTLRLIKRVVCGCGVILSGLLSACSMDLQSGHTAVSAPDFDSPASMNSMGKGITLDDYETPSAKVTKLGLTADEVRAFGCSMGDRFDRGAALAYNFKDDQSRVALHLSMEGPSFSDPGRLQFNSVMVRFTHKFQKPSTTEKKKCLFPSGFQGMAGSIYNEFFVRENYTIWQELRERGLDFK